MHLRRIHSGTLSLMLTIALALAPTSAHSEPSASDRETARGLVLDGREKLSVGDYEGALKSLRAAHEIMGVPTTGLDLARAQAARGLLMEARATAFDVTRMPAKLSEPEAFTEARSTAAELAQGLTGRIPSLVITVKGVDTGVTLSTSVDGVRVPLSILGLQRKVNPGVHTIEASAPGYRAERRDVKINERETIPVEIALERSSSERVLGGSSVPPATIPLQRLPSGATLSRADGPAGQGGSVPTWAWMAGGAGLVALGAGVAFGLDYANVSAKIATDCPGNVCDASKYTVASAQALANHWNRDLGLLISCSAAGVLGVSAAIVGIASAPRRRELPAPVKSAVAAPWLSRGVLGAVVQGKF